MELRQLRSFLAVVRHGSFTRAAEELYLTQSALSQQIRRLEDELGVALLYRTARGAELTPAGADLHARAERIVEEAERARQAMDAHAGALRGLLRVGAAHGDAPWLADALVAFHGDHPGVRMALRQGSTAGVLERLRRGALDLAVTGLTAVERAGLGLATAPADGAGLATAPADAAGRVAYGSGGLLAEPLATDRLVLACAPGHPLADRAHVAIGDLRDEPFVLPEPETALREAVLAAFAPAGFSPVPRFETTDPATVRLLVHAGLGVSLVPASWLRMPGPAVVAAPLPGDVADYERFAVRPAGAEAPAGRLLMHRLRAPVR